jgi:hypothetical protein
VRPQKGPEGASGLHLCEPHGSGSVADHREDPKRNEENE